MEMHITLQSEIYTGFYKKSKGLPPFYVVALAKTTAADLQLYYTQTHCYV